MGESAKQHSWLIPNILSILIDGGLDFLQVGIKVLLQNQAMCLFCTLNSSIELSDSQHFLFSYVSQIRVKTNHTCRQNLNYHIRRQVAFQLWYVKVDLGHLCRIIKQKCIGQNQVYGLGILHAPLLQNLTLFNHFCV